jgi:hypothetical protein
MLVGDHFVYHFVLYVVWGGHNVVYPGCEFHDSQGVFESPMRGARVDQMRHAELIDMAESLHGLRVKDSALV